MGFWACLCIILPLASALRPYDVPVESLFRLLPDLGFCDDEEEDELFSDDGRDDLADDFCDDNEGVW